MPVYNNEKLLPNAVKSIKNQSFSDWELIIVDDGSTDNTPEVADCLAKTDNRIKVIHQENQWIYKSFNNGIAEASGKYVFVVNSDDTINKDSLYHIYNVASRDNADIVMFNLTMSRCDANQNVIDYDIYGYEKLLADDFSYSDIKVIHQKWVEFLRLKLLGHQCVYKTEIAKSIPYRTDIYGGDFYYNIQIADIVNAVAGTAYPVYNYYIYQSADMNASVNKYYGYEHDMFNEFYSDYKNLFEKWNVFDNNTKDYLVSARLNNLTSEIRSYASPKCFLTTDEKIKSIILNASDDVVYVNAIEVGRREEWESRILSGLREIFVREIPSESSEYYFIYELLEALLCYEKDDKDIAIIHNSVYHQLNIHNIGKSFLNKIIGSYS